MECLQGAIRCGVVVREFISHKSYIGILFFWKANIDMENPPYVELTNIGVVSQWCQPQTVVVSLGQVRIFGFQCQVFFMFCLLLGPFLYMPFLFIFSETSVQANVWDSNH